MPRESAADFQARDAALRALNEPCDGWRDRGAADIGAVMEALGLTADDLARVLALADQVTDNFIPAGLEIGGYRFGVRPPERVTGEPLGVYRGVVVVAWTVTR